MGKNKIVFNERTGEFEETSENSIGEIIIVLISLIIGVCVFFFYAKAKFGIIGGFFYSLYWFITIPIDFFFF